MYSLVLEVRSKLEVRKWMGKVGKAMNGDERNVFRQCVKNRM